MTRAEHLQWAKNRAMEYVNAGDYTSAVASMLSDLGMHEGTASSARIGSALMLTVKDRKTATDFVQGFN